ncbi:DUF3592 domain-containing protein [Hungatella hathewayi]|uniref:DUF3592 domain-containing protein n=1 Tax=Hungatella hathewayi WAL-18680 TaxID=742737 RepID=G5IMW8_9FIRM|nr:hypothetical protein [Hungatella hathewayi]EHI57151.1 hypothetical protein HMPREF9473_04846 [ [Hungatella hathewayi WAL-18680]
MICYLACFGFAIALLDCIRLYCNIRKCNCSALGAIIEVEETLSHSKNRIYLNYQPIYQYTVLGKTFTNKINMISSDPESYKLNSKVLLYYEESNPQNFIPSDEIKYIKKSVIVSALLFLISLAILVWINVGQK